jgi:hypothetical protein
VRVRATSLWLIKRGLNPIALNLAGRAPRLLAVIYHQGRRSARRYATPVVAKPVSTGFVVPLTWGEQADWYRNLRASGGGELTWQGRRYPIGRPELLTPGVGLVVFGPLQRLGLQLGRIRLVRLRRLGQ